MEAWKTEGLVGVAMHGLFCGLRLLLDVGVGTKIRMSGLPLTKQTLRAVTALHNVKFEFRPEQLKLPDLTKRGMINIMG